MALMRPRANQVNFDVTDISDPLIRINSSQSGANDKDIGIVFERGSDTNVAVMWDESADELVIANTAEDGSTGGNVTISSYANIRANAFYGDGSNLTGITSYGDSDVAAYLSANGYGTSSSIIASITDSAPTTLDTLNELAAALGDDANFSTTITNSIATKWTQDNTKISNWDTAYSWGNHASAGYLTSYTETDPVFSAHTTSNIINGTGLLKNDGSGNWSYDTSTYLTSYTETDPLYTSSPASGITSTKITNWDIAYGWGNHASAGYLTSETSHADVLVDGDFTTSGIMSTNGSGTYSIITDNSSNWNTAFGWGNHASEGYITDYTVTQADVTTHQAALSITESQISDLGSYLVAGDITSKANLASPTFTGTPAAPTAAAGTNTTQIATTAFVGTAVSNLVDSAPGTLNTLNELAAALGDDANFSTTVTNSIATKLPLAGGTMTGSLTLNTGSNFGLKVSTDGSPWSLQIERSDLSFNSGIYNDGDALVFQHSPKFFNSGSKATIWHSANDGSGSGLDADTLDGNHASSFATSGHTHSYISPTELGISLVGNFGQWQNHNAYASGFNTEPAYWGWNYVQSNTNAPNSSSSQWYRNRLSLGDAYGKGTAAGDYWLEIGHPRYSHGSAGHMWMRTCENGTVGSWTQVGSSIVGDWSATGNATATNFYGTASSAKYADLAEKYTTDQEYPIGTAMCVGGEAETTAAGNDCITIGVISEKPAYLMNSDSEGQAIGLKGRVPVRVKGAVRKGQAIYAWENGVCSTVATMGMVGVALESNDIEEEKLVECVLKV
jgi:hypothetical protein